MIISEVWILMCVIWIQLCMLNLSVPPCLPSIDSLENLLHCSFPRSTNFIGMKIINNRSLNSAKLSHFVTLGRASSHHEGELQSRERWQSLNLLRNHVASLYQHTSSLPVSYCFLYFVTQLTAHRQTQEEPKSTILVLPHACIKHTK